MRKVNSNIIRENKEIEIINLLSKGNLDSGELSHLKALVQEKNIKWDEFFKYIKEESVRPLVLNNLLKYLNFFLPKSIAEKAKNILNSFTFQAFRNIKQLVSLLKLFEKENIPVIPWKGILLSEKIFKSPTLRETVDIDILIQSKDINRAKQIMIENGYLPLWKMNQTQEKAYIYNHHSYEFIKKGDLDVELHWRISKEQYMLNLPIEKLWETSINYKFANIEMQYPNDEYLLIGLLIHHGGVECWLKYKLVVDFYYLMISYPNLNWEIIMKLAEELGMRRIVLVGLYLCNQLFAVNIPKEAARNLNKKDINIAEKILKNYFQEEKIKKQSTILIELREKWYHKILVSYKILTTPSLIDSFSYNRSNFIMRITRPIRLIRRFILKKDLTTETKYMNR